MKHIKCTYLLLRGRYSVHALAKMHGTTFKTIYNWRDLVLNTYDDPEAVGLKRFSEKSA